MGDTTTASILDRCRALGFALAGVASAQRSNRVAELRAWLEAGRNGSMSWLEDHLELRIDPRALVPAAQSVICVADRYADGRPDRRDRSLAGRVARYARGADYHTALRRRLETLRDELRRTHPKHRFRACVDTAPILEREQAARAGLGAIGKHTLLIEPGVGSWLLLGEIVTTLALEPTTSDAALDVCGTCSRCIDACPTAAIEPWTVDASRCISYLTIERRLPIDPTLHAAIGDWIFGCDICQEVCPHCQPTRRSRAAKRHPDYAPVRTTLDALEVLGWNEDDWARAGRSGPLERATLAMFRRNALIVATNTCPPERRAELAARFRTVAESSEEDPMVRETARQSLSRLARPEPTAKDSAQSEES
ncbi:MAG: tRNA epoxyqueuosine(34) reductase QueG [Phycisphaerales bacterium]|nr:tRNA epoxyqueuosine(34) reductase QueG [Phycisphaerales bacterium]